MNVGDRVTTPDGPGTVTSFWQVFEGWHRRMDIVVELDEGGQGWRKIYRQYELEPEAFSSKAENQAEALEVERHQEAKHRARGEDV